MKTFYSILVIVNAANIIIAQENAATNVADSLIECYNNTDMTTRDNRLPATMSVLIALIRKVENNNVANAREIAIQLLQRFRQDGIRKKNRDQDIEYGLLYAPNRWENFKLRIQLSKLTPGNAQTFNNNSLTRLERCSLHHILSSTVEIDTRGDEDKVCKKSAGYTVRNKRETELTESFHSDCPIEDGVVLTKWGTVKAGLLIGGIASGLARQKIPTKNGTVDNRYASTIAGELSEAAIYQVKSDIKIGAKGGWNSTVAPRYYFLQDNKELHATDAEIRGGLDGLYMALNAENWKNKFGDIKVSQILDMYYSLRGVFDDSLKACKRKELETSQTSTDQLVSEVFSFNFLLNEVSVTDASPDKNKFLPLAKNAVSSFNSYLASMTDTSCSDQIIERIATNLIIFIDFNWSYRDIDSYLTYILDNIDVNSYETTYTIINGANSEILVNRTSSILDFYEVYNRTTHDKVNRGFNYKNVIITMESMFMAYLNNETEIADGQSTIALLMPHTSPTSEDKNYANDMRQRINRFLPDLKVLVLGIGGKENYINFVMNSNNDVFEIKDNSTDIDIISVATKLIERIKKIPRNVVNPSCGSSFASTGPNNFDVVQYVEPRGRNYHKISPNYFVRGSDDETTKLKIFGQSYGTLTVCMSRNEIHPENSTGDCKEITSQEVSFDISNYCEGDIIDCSPIYLSVEGQKSEARCTDSKCRFPDSIKYTITLENVGCKSGTLNLSSLGLGIILIFESIHILL